METSAKSGFHVETAFLMLASDIKNKMDRKNASDAPPTYPSGVKLDSTQQQGKKSGCC
jgi:hypothetical protein